MPWERLVVYALLLLSAAACSKENVAVLPSEVLGDEHASELVVCLADQLSVRFAQNLGDLESAIGRIGYVDKRLRYRYVPLKEGECPAAAAHGCWSAERRIYCDGYSLVRIQTAIAIQSAAWAVKNSDNFLHNKPVTAHSSIALMNALVISDSLLMPGNNSLQPRTGMALLASMDDATYRGQSLNMGEWQQLYTSTSAAILRQDSDGKMSTEPAELIGYEVYEAATNWFLASLIGHESSHAHGHCDIDDKFPSELDVFPQLAVVHQACLDALNSHEASAEACSWRAVNRTTSEMILFKSKHDRWSAEQVQALLQVAGGIAIGAQAIALVGGLDARTPEAIPTEQEIDGVFTRTATNVTPFPTLRVPSGHLFPFLRNELFALAIMKNLVTDDRSLLSCAAMALLYDATPQLPTRCMPALLSSLTELHSYDCMRNHPTDGWKACCRDQSIPTAP